ncbi:MAG: GTP-binding protein, partial [Myxococcota bacterium]
MTSPRELRNVAIIAHVDHGKTTLVDAMLRQTGAFHRNEVVEDRVMDSNDLERERGITILAKHASIEYRDVTINIIDTPGHADFGGEVERTLMMADGGLLLVDAAEGPLPQTRFVVQKALTLGLPLVVVINKIDRQDARPDEVLNEVFDLFCELGATDEQADFQTIYAVAKDGIAKNELEDESESIEPLLKAILDRVPAPQAPVEEPFQFRVHNIMHDEYVGRLAIGKINRGKVAPHQPLVLIGESKSAQAKAGPVFGYRATKRVRLDDALAGDIIALAGIENVQIGDTLADPADPVALPRIEVEEPTIKIRFVTNSSPVAGRAGKWVTSRHLRDQLFQEAKRNLALRVE